MAGKGISWVVLGSKPTVVATVVLVGFEVVEKVAFFHFLEEIKGRCTSAQIRGIDRNGSSCTDMD